MDIERMKRLPSGEIEAGNKVKAVREVIKTYNTQKRICMMIQKNF